VATDFGSAPPPAFGDAPASAPITVNVTVASDTDPDRPLRRVKK